MPSKPRPQPVTYPEVDPFQFAQLARAGRKLKKPKSINVKTDAFGVVTMTNETGRPCTDDNKTLRVLLVRDLRKGHPQLKPGLLGRTIPQTSDYYRYVGVNFDIGVTEVVSISAVQVVTENAATDLAHELLAKTTGTAFDWDDTVSDPIIRRWETATYYPGHYVVD